MGTTVDGLGLDAGPPSEQVTPAAALETVAAAAALLFESGQTTERTVRAAERLGRALGLPVTVYPRWGEFAIHADGTLLSHIVRTTPLGVDMGRVLATMTILDQACAAMLTAAAARSALAQVARRPPVSTLRFGLLAAIGAAALGVIFGAVDPVGLILIALSAGLGVVVRRRLTIQPGSVFLQPLCAAFAAGLIGAVADRLQLSHTQGLVALCPCMVLVPGPHILNGALDLVRTRIALGIARVAYAGLVVLMICAGLLLGLAAGGSSLPDAGASAPVPLGADVIAAGCAVAAFGTFFSMPWRLLAVPIAVGMLAHAARWALISLAGADVVMGALVACVLVGIIVTPVADRLHLPFAALGFSAVVSMMPGFFLFRAASDLVILVSVGQHAPPGLLPRMVANGATAFLIILAMSFGVILPLMLYDQIRHARAPRTPAEDGRSAPGRNRPA